MRKASHVILLITAVVLADQALKVYIKTHFYINESHEILGSWFRLHFVENEGMAYGWKLGGDGGKMLLTLFRLGAVIFGVYYLRSILKKKQHPGFILCAALIFAGALGNLIDSMFYGLIFEESVPGSMAVARIFPEQGYAGFLHGKVVDMLYFPIISGYWPDWVPIVGGRYYQFFKPVFNIADFAITLGVLNILFFQRSFLSSKIIHSEPEKDNENTEPEEEISSDLADSAAVDSLQPLENPETPAGG